MSQKSLALVLSGQPRFAIDSVQRQISLLKKNYNVSIFFHTWDENSSLIKSTAPWVNDTKLSFDNISNLTNQLHPLKFSSLPLPNNFLLKKDNSSDKSIQWRLQRMFWSIMQADLVRQNYEIENNIKFNYIVRSRFDFYPITNTLVLPSEHLLNNKVYIPDLIRNPYAPCDWFLITNSNTMSKITNLYYKLSQYIDQGTIYAGEELLLEHLNMNSIRFERFIFSGFIRRENRCINTFFGKILLVDSFWLWIFHKIQLFLFLLNKLRKKLLKIFLSI